MQIRHGFAHRSARAGRGRDGPLSPLAGRQGSARRLRAAALAEDLIHTRSLSRSLWWSDVRGTSLEITSLLMQFGSYQVTDNPSDTLARVARVERRSLPPVMERRSLPPVMTSSLTSWITDGCWWGGAVNTSKKSAFTKLVLRRFRSGKKRSRADGTHPHARLQTLRRYRTLVGLPLQCRRADTRLSHRESP